MPWSEGDPAQPLSAPAAARADALFARYLGQVYEQADRVMSWIFAAQWAFAVSIALIRSPYTWVGSVRELHVHIVAAFGFGGLLFAAPLAMMRLARGSALSRHVVAASQMLWSALLIHVTGGRIETHFHVFGSLAFLAFYLDWRMLLTATTTVVADHVLRGLTWPASVYGIPNPAWWRFLEHALWIVFEASVLVFGCLRGLRDLRRVALRESELEATNADVETLVVRRTAELAASREQYRQLVESMRAIPWEGHDGADRLDYIGPQAVDFFGYSLEQLHSRSFLAGLRHPDDRARIDAAISEAIATGKPYELEYRMRRSDGLYMNVRTTMWVGPDEPGRPRRVRGLIFDESERKQLELELRQAQRLESVGRLAAGVAHEINTPVQFTSDSVHFLKDAVADAAALFARHRAIAADVSAGRLAPAETLAAFDAADDAADLGYLSEHVPKAVAASLDGLGRVSEIVRSMKAFAHPDGKAMTSVDLNEALRSTLVIARNEYKHVAEVHAEYGEVPRVVCHGGEINQVLLNLIVNAAHAIGDAVGGSDARGVISVSTRGEGDDVVVTVEDNGTGIPEAIREKIFEQFFTTKPVGKGTGQGLAIARSVVAKHGGKLTFTSTVGRGARFEVRLPVRGTSQAAAA